MTQEVYETGAPTHPRRLRRRQQYLATPPTSGRQNIDAGQGTSAASSADVDGPKVWRDTTQAVLPGRLHPRPRPPRHGPCPRERRPPDPLRPGAVRPRPPTHKSLSNNGDLTHGNTHPKVRNCLCSRRVASTRRGVRAAFCTYAAGSEAVREKTASRTITMIVEVPKPWPARTMMILNGRPHFKQQPCWLEQVC